MARIRSIKPSFFTDAKICRLSVHARLLFIATWTIADDGDGVFDARISMLKNAAFFEDPVTPEQVFEWFEELVALALVRTFDHHGEPFAVVRHWGRHQVISKPAKKCNPDPPAELPTPAAIIPAIPRNPQESPGKPRAIPAIPRNPQESPEFPEPHARAPEGKGREGKGREEEGTAPEIPGAFPEPPPPPASQEERPPAEPAPAAQNSKRTPFVLRLAARARETITPRGAAPPEPDDAECDAWAALLAREPEAEWERWWLPRLLELMGQIAASGRHGPGGGFIIASPAHLLQPQKRGKPESGLVIAEMLTKFQTRLETPERRKAKERAAFVNERVNEIIHAQMTERGSTRVSAKEEHGAREQAEIEWAEREAAQARAGPGG